MKPIKLSTVCPNLVSSVLSSFLNFALVVFFFPDVFIKPVILGWANGVKLLSTKTHNDFGYTSTLLSMKFS